MPKSPFRIIAFRCMRPEHPIFIELHYVQQCLSNFQAIVIDAAVCILCQTQFLSKNEMRSLNLTKSVALSNVVLGMAICGVEKRKISVKYCSGRL